MIVFNVLFEFPLMAARRNVAGLAKKVSGRSGTRQLSGRFLPESRRKDQGCQTVRFKTDLGKF
jgi:hypothetical protein